MIGLNFFFFFWKFGLADDGFDSYTHDATALTLLHSDTFAILVKFGNH